MTETFSCQCRGCRKTTKHPVRIAGNWWCMVSCYRRFYRLNSPPFKVSTRTAHHAD